MRHRQESHRINTQQDSSIQINTGETITVKSKQMERWVEHYSDLYGRENIIYDATLETVKRLPVMEELDETPILTELSKAIARQSHSLQNKCNGWMESQKKLSTVTRDHSLDSCTFCFVSARWKGNSPGQERL